MRERLTKALKGGEGRKALALVIALALLMLLPIGFGGANLALPVIGGAEKLVDDQCLTVLARAAKAYGLIQTLDGILAVMRSAGFNAGFLGVGASVSPGEVLSAPHDTVKSLSSFFLTVILVMLVVKQAVGVMSYLCFKILLPIGLICFLAHLVFGRRPRLKRVGFLFLKTGLILWAALPLAALLGSVIEERFIAVKYEAHAEALTEKIKAVARLGGLSAAREGNLSLGDMARLGFYAFQAAKERGQTEGGAASEGKLRELSQHLNDMLNLLLLLYALLVLSAYVLPLIVLGLLFGVFIIIAGSASSRPLTEGGSHA